MPHIFKLESSCTPALKVESEIDDGIPCDFDPFLVDGLNILDKMILSSESLDNLVLNESHFNMFKLTVFIRDIELIKDYFLIEPVFYEEVGFYSNAAKDWTPDSSAPVRADASMNHDIALDEQLKFPIIAPHIVEKARTLQLNIEFFEYPTAI